MATLQSRHAALALVVLVCVTAADMPLPFTRELTLRAPCLNGTDVGLIQLLVARAVPLGGYAPWCYDNATATAVSAFQRTVGLAPSGTFDAPTAVLALSRLEEDGWRDNDTAPAQLGFKYKIRVDAHLNRSIESTATLFAGNGTAIFSWRARAHGADIAGTDPTWPSFSSCCAGASQFARNGNTPSGLMSLDLNSPEDDAKEFGPWPVNRAVQGLEGNAAFSLPRLRDGILVHTGEWANYSNWHPPLDMPNSLGCIHNWPETIERLWHELVALGVDVRPNTGGARPYPYAPQGLLAVQLVD